MCFCCFFIFANVNICNICLLFGLLLLGAAVPNGGPLPPTTSDCHASYEEGWEDKFKVLPDDVLLNRIQSLGYQRMRTYLQKNTTFKKPEVDMSGLVSSGVSVR